MARNKNSVPMYENEFIGSNSKKTIKIGEKVFKIRNKSKITIAAARLYREYMKITNKVAKMADVVDMEELEEMEKRNINQDDLSDLDETLDMASNMFDYMADMSEIAWNILTLLLGEEAMEYIDELEYTEEDVLKLMQLVYDIAKGQKRQEKQSDGEKVEDTFR